MPRLKLLTDASILRRVILWEKLEAPVECTAVKSMVHAIEPLVFIRSDSSEEHRFSTAAMRPLEVVHKSQDSQTFNLF